MSQPKLTLILTKNGRELRAESNDYLPKQVKHIPVLVQEKFNVMSANFRYLIKSNTVNQELPNDEEYLDKYYDKSQYVEIYVV